MRVLFSRTKTRRPARVSFLSPVKLNLENPLYRCINDRSVLLVRRAFKSASDPTPLTSLTNSLTNSLTKREKTMDRLRSSWRDFVPRIPRACR